MSVQMNHYLLPFILLGSNPLSFSFPKPFWKANLEYYKNISPPARVQRRAMFSVPAEQFAWENTHSNERAYSWGLS